MASLVESSILQAAFTMAKGDLKYRLRRLWKKDPKCHWCGEPTFLILIPEGVELKIGKQHPKMATIDHLYSRYDPERKERFDGEPQTVLACHACNDRRNEEEQAAVPVEERTKRARELNEKRSRRKKKWKRELPVVFTEKMKVPEDHKEFNKQVNHLHYLANRGILLIRKPESSENPEEELERIANEIYLALTGKQL
jgi:hypothetical protein